MMFTILVVLLNWSWTGWFDFPTFLEGPRRSPHTPAIFKIYGHRLLKVAVHPRACMRETNRFRFEAIHQDYSNACKCVIVQFACCRLNHVAPCELLLLQRNTFFFENIETHYN